MIANLHTHTYRCRHASGKEREYIETALQIGMKTLGFSDHTPYPFPETHYSGVRMFINEQEDYVNTLISLREEYKDRIDIKIGYEVEYYPKHFKECLNLLNRYELDYIILGQHYLNNEYDGECATAATDDANRFDRMICQMIEGMDTGVFTYVAHPDNFYFVGDKKILESQYRRLIEHAKKLSLPLELNFLGLRTGRHYPHEFFFKLCGEMNADICLGCDAHAPEHVNDAASLATANEWIEKYKLHVVENPPLRKVIL